MRPTREEIEAALKNADECLASIRHFGEGDLGTGAIPLAAEVRALRKDLAEARIKMAFEMAGYARALAEAYPIPDKRVDALVELLELKAKAAREAK